jgi:hypothetical protein
MSYADRRYLRWSLKSAYQGADAGYDLQGLSIDVVVVVAKQVFIDNMCCTTCELECPASGLNELLFVHG